MTKWKAAQSKAGLKLGQGLPWTSTRRLSDVTAVVTLGLLVGATAFTYGVAQESTSTLVKTAGYATAGLLAASIVAGVLVALAQ